MGSNPALRAPFRLDEITRIRRAIDISLKDGVELAAIRLKKSNTLIGTALNLPTEDAKGIWG